MMGGGMSSGGYQGAEQLKMLICTTISPEIWKMVYDEENGQWKKNENENAKATIQYFDGKLIVTAPRSVHEAIGGSVDF
jgi:hypothetical protein